MVKSLAVQRPFSIESAIDEWLYRKRVARSGSEKTQVAYRSTLESFRAFLWGVELDLLDDPVDVERAAAIWAAERQPGANRSGKVADSTYNQRLSIISSFYSFLRTGYKLDIHNPIKDIEKRRVQAYAYAEPIDAGEVGARLCEIDRTTVAGKRDYALLVIGLTTGRRAGELVGLRLRDIRRSSNGKLTLWFHCKGGKIRRNELDDDTAAALMDYLQSVYGEQLSVAQKAAPVWVSFSRRNFGQAISYDTLRDICTRYLERSQTHAMRHTNAKEMEKDGATLTEIQYHLGHSSAQTTERYLKELGSEHNPHAPALARRFGIRKG
jgi:site-specific recombinase XerD